MSDNTLSRLTALRQNNVKKSWVNKDLYRMLFKRDIYIAAYEKIKSSPGNMTEGSDGETIDGFSLKKIDLIIEEMKTSTFQFKPAKRVEIPKANGKKRPLGIPSNRDKVVQAAMLMILESIYDGSRPYFLECSHGFRPNKSTHTALEQYRKTWHGTTWILEGDINACFDEIDHQILIEIIRRKIDDDRFIQLLWKSLKAGHMEFKTGFHTTVSGTPQGSIISPILANIYLHELDVRVMAIVKRENKGEKRQANPEYRSLVRKRQRLIKTKGVEADAPEVRELTRLIRETPSVMPDDPNFIRVKYLRYTDDWIVGVTGDKTLVKKIKEEIKNFLHSELKLQLSEEKTKITHAASGKALFLGTLLGISSTEDQKLVGATIKGVQTLRRSSGSKTLLKIPAKALIARLMQEGFCDGEKFPKSKGAWVHLDEYDLVARFNAVNRGLSNYYRFADNFSAMSGVQYILKYSLAKTIAHKRRLSMQQVFAKHGDKLYITEEIAEGKFRSIQFWHNPSYKRMPLDGFPSKKEKPDFINWTVRKLSKSRLGHNCCICGSHEEVEMHHLRRIRGHKKALEKDSFSQIMGKINRKQVPLCDDCHIKVHRGEYNGIKLSDLVYVPT